MDGIPSRSAARRKTAECIGDKAGPDHRRYRSRRCKSRRKYQNRSIFFEEGMKSGGIGQQMMCNLYEQGLEGRFFSSPQ